MNIPEYLKVIVDEKDYNKIANLNLNTKTKIKVQNYATSKRALSIATLLNKQNSFNHYKVKNTKLVKEFYRMFKNYQKGDFENLGNAAKLLSFHFFDLTKSNFIGNRKKEYEQTKYIKLKKSDITKQILTKFKKNRQWPHLSMYLFPTYNLGSCHDLTLIKAMYNEKVQRPYQLSISLGLNTLQSHIVIHNYVKYNRTSQNEKNIRFLLMSMFHCFRSFQTIKYSVKNKTKLQRFKETIYSILFKCTKNKELSLLLLQFLLTRHTKYYKHLFPLKTKLQKFNI